jgi:hypothetical protein
MEILIQITLAFAFKNQSLQNLLQSEEEEEAKQKRIDVFNGQPLFSCPTDSNYDLQVFFPSKL